MVTSIPGCDHVSFYTIFLFVRMIMLINIGLINVRLIILLCHDLLFTNIYDVFYKNGRKRAVILLLLPFFNYSQKASLTNSCAHSRPTDSLKMPAFT